MFLKEQSVLCYKHLFNIEINNVNVLITFTEKGFRLRGLREQLLRPNISVYIILDLFSRNVNEDVFRDLYVPQSKTFIDLKNVLFTTTRLGRNFLAVISFYFSLSLFLTSNFWYKK